MSVRSACEACRQVKAKCDLAQPTCRRCLRRGVVCSYSGGLRQGLFPFKDQNDFAQRKSEIARGTVPSPPESADLPDEALLRRQYPWLNDRGIAEVPRSVRRGLEQRAIDCFFDDWVLFPHNHGTSPGYMKELPSLYLSAPKDSVLRPAVQAMAFAGLKDVKSRDGVEFSLKAQRAYGDALVRMQDITSKEGKFASDWTLAALLLMDNFEMMYLGRLGPLAAHQSALKHFVHAKGNEPLFLKESCGIWRTAHHRLHVFQILSGEAPAQEQIQWVERLDTTRPDLRISADVLNANRLCAAAHAILQNTRGRHTSKLTRIAELVKSISELLSGIDNWTSEVPEVWRSKRSTLFESTDAFNIESSDIDVLASEMRGVNYSDVWLTYMWNFHFAAQITLRECLIELLKRTMDMQPGEPLSAETARVTFELHVIGVLSRNVIASFPSLLAYADDTLRDSFIQTQGRLVGRFFVLLSAWSIGRAKYTPEEHKRLASDVCEHILAGHRVA